MLHLGNLYFTRGIQQLIDDEYLEFDEVWEIISRHQDGDYGTVGEDSYKINAESIKNNFGTVMSQYQFIPFKVWVITTLAQDETYTTVLLPEEY